jgi:hypothetical protein
VSQLFGSQVSSRKFNKQLWRTGKGTGRCKVANRADNVLRPVIRFGRRQGCFCWLRIYDSLLNSFRRE